jgi:hypothetical protein
MTTRGSQSNILMVKASITPPLQVGCWRSHRLIKILFEVEVTEGK